MKNVLKIVFISICIFAMLFTRIYAEESITKQAVAITNISELHKYVIKHNENYLVKQSDGIIAVMSKKLDKIKNVDKNILEEYKKAISNINFGIANRLISASDDFTFFPNDIVTEGLPEKDLSEEQIGSRSVSFELLEECRIHRQELRNTFDSYYYMYLIWDPATAYINAYAATGIFFTEKVKSGANWDYKSYLGTATTYYIPELNRTITGEHIGNYHYGYVGSEVFLPMVLKTAAGLYQIKSGTSSIAFWNSYFDDPKDQTQIQEGIDRYDVEI